MELKPGYKQTEVGVIPEDWRTPNLDSLTVLMTNGFVGTATTHYASNENGILYIQGYNVEENSFNFHGIKFVTEDFHKDSHEVMFSGRGFTHCANRRSRANNHCSGILGGFKLPCTDYFEVRPEASFTCLYLVLPEQQAWSLKTQTDRNRNNDEAFERR